MHIGIVIKELRIEKRLSQTDLAKKCGITNAYISQIENQKQEPSLLILEKISIALEIPLYIFFIKAIKEEGLVNSDQKRFAREIKKVIENEIQNLYQ